MEGIPVRLLLCFSLPLFLGNLLGDSALSQIGATAVLYSLITNTAFGLNNGLALAVSRYFGAAAVCDGNILDGISMAILVILRNTLQGMQNTVSLLLRSALELAGKVIFALWSVPDIGYAAVCICESVTWVVCVIFIFCACIMHRTEFQGQEF